VGEDPPADSIEIALGAQPVTWTVKTYLDSVGLFVGYLERSGMPTRLDRITREHVEAFIAAELERVEPDLSAHPLPRVAAVLQVGHGGR
jgi:hypothetical protein